MKGEFVSKAKKLGITSFVYKRRNPFHPDRLSKFVDGPHMDRIFRSKGFFWIATRNGLIGSW